MLPSPKEGRIWISDVAVSWTNPNPFQHLWVTATDDGVLSGLGYAHEFQTGLKHNCTQNHSVMFSFHLDSIDEKYISHILFLVYTIMVQISFKYAIIVVGLSVLVRTAYISKIIDLSIHENVIWNQDSNVSRIYTAIFHLNTYHAKIISHFHFWKAKKTDQTFQKIRNF